MTKAQICLAHAVLSLISLSTYTLMNLDVINGLDSGGQVSHRLANVLCKYHNSTATTDIKYSLRMPKTGSFSLASFVVQLMPLCSKTLSRSFNTLEDGPPLLFTTPPLVHHHPLPQRHARAASHISAIPGRASLAPTAFLHLSSTFIPFAFSTTSLQDFALIISA